MLRSGNTAAVHNHLTVNVGASVGAKICNGVCNFPRNGNTLCQCFLCALYYGLTSRFHSWVVVVAWVFKISAKTGMHHNAGCNAVYDYSVRRKLGGKCSGKTENSALCRRIKSKTRIAYLSGSFGPDVNDFSGMILYQRIFIKKERF